MIFIFAAIPFTDFLIVRYVDDRVRSRIAGMRLTVSFGISSLAVWMLGPAVKGMGFETMMLILAGVAACTTAIVCLLPREGSEQTVTEPSDPKIDRPDSRSSPIAS